MSKSSVFELRQIDGANFVLTKTEPQGTSYSIPLTGDDVLEMAHKLPEFAQRILKSRLPSAANLPGYEIAAVAAVASAKVGLDIHQTMIGLSLIDVTGTPMNYSLTSEAGRDIGGKLTAAADKLDGAAPTKQ
jgi:hypothetical protein